MMTGTNIIGLPFIKYFQWNYSIIYGTTFVTSQTILFFHFCCFPFTYECIICVTIIEWRNIIEIWICNIRLVSKTWSVFILTHFINRQGVLLHANYHIAEYVFPFLYRERIILFNYFLYKFVFIRYFLFIQSKLRNIVTAPKNPPRTQFLDTWYSKVSYTLPIEWIKL